MSLFVEFYVEKIPLIYYNVVNKGNVYKIFSKKRRNMKKIVFYGIFVFIFCLSFASCEDAKRPIDYPDSEWVCEKENIRFSVSDDGVITDASMIGKNGETVCISLVFGDMEEGKVTVTDPDGNEIYFVGKCTYKKDMFSVFVTDIYSPNVQFSSTRLTFERS